MKPGQFWAQCAHVAFVDAWHLEAAAVLLESTDPVRSQASHLESRRLLDVALALFARARRDGFDSRKRREAFACSP